MPTPQLLSHTLAWLAKKRKGGSFFGQSPKNEPPFLFLASVAKLVSYILQIPLL
ncbi:MAG: hypothetical protein U5L45_05880 [Saprospiraceae bacterium]|nr:hypothetical protein [Saprospiraceae bacterium]